MIKTSLESFAIGTSQLKSGFDPPSFFRIIKPHTSRKIVNRLHRKSKRKKACSF